MKQFFIILAVLSFFACENQKTIKIEWVDHLTGDYSFTRNWNYPENVFRNEYGELVCDGFCDETLDKMRDENGKIIPDSSTRYYQLLDTTHLYHSLQNEAQTYEWAGADFAEASGYSDNTIICHTLRNAATHSSLVLRISKNYCLPYIELHSITNTEPEFFGCKGGWIKVDKNLLKKGILKTEFDLEFIHPDNNEISMWWRGKIYTSIKNR